MVIMEGIYSMEMVDLGKYLKWLNEILKSVGLKWEMVADTRERVHKMQKKTVKNTVWAAGPLKFKGAAPYELRGPPI